MNHKHTQLSVVCRDCGDVNHVSRRDLAPGDLVTCASCGLTLKPASNAGLVALASGSRLVTGQSARFQKARMRR